MGLKDALGKFDNARKKATSKLPDPLRKKADNKLGLFLHKNIATVFYFDEDIQEVYWEMEEAIEEGDKDRAMELSAEMKTLITMKSDPNNGVSTRKHRKAASKLITKIEEAQGLVKGKTEDKNLKDFLKMNTEEEDMDEDIEEMMEELEDQ